MNDTITQFYDAIRLAGLKPPETIYIDGQLHRFGTSEKPGDKAGWYILYGDGIPAGSFGDWRTGANHSWHSDIGRTLTEAETVEHQKKLNAMREAREAAEEKRYNEVARQAASLWNAAIEAPANHPYLLQKGVEAYGLREHKGRLIVPVRTPEAIQSLQFIDSSGSKRFLCGGKLRGGYFSIGAPKDIICICEGYATGASIFKATGYAVAVAFTAANLGLVAKILHKKFPDRQLILCADDDIWTAGNPGLKKAQEAAAMVGGLLAIPRFGENRSPGLSDFNDLQKHSGVEAVKRIISEVVEPNGVKLICSTDMEPKAVAWLWKNWLALSKFHILAGTPGTGKTTIALNLAAIVSRGGQWPDGTQCESPGNVLIWSGEDDPEDTLLPRLLMHGAEQKRIYFISDVIENNKARVFDPACDIPKLYEKASKMEGVRLIIIDPIVNAISGDSHKNVEVRRSLQPLIELGKKLKAVILGISHFSKGGSLGREPLERVTGSIAFGALARIVLATAKMTDPNGEEKRVLVRAKSNHGPDGGGYHYHIAQKELEGRSNVSGSQIIWGEAIQGNPRDLLTDPNELRTAKVPSALSEAVGFLKEILAEGLVDNRIITEKAKELSINYSTLQRAKTLLEIEAVREGFGKGSVWKWYLPSKTIKNLEDDQPEKVENMEKNDHLLLDLARRHPAMVEGCKLSDILLHAVPEDYEELKDPAILACLARSLKKSGKVKVYN